MLNYDIYAENITLRDINIVGHKHHFYYYVTLVTFGIKYCDIMAVDVTPPHRLIFVGRLEPTQVGHQSQ
jgi:hypothetical protein